MLVFMVDSSVMIMMRFIMRLMFGMFSVLSMVENGLVFIVGLFYGSMVMIMKIDLM